MLPWHSLVCHDPKIDLPTSVLRNVRRIATGQTAVDSQGKTSCPTVEVASEQREVPIYVRRLIELSRATRDALPGERTYLDFAYWSSGNTPGDDIAGIAVIDEEV